MKKTLRFFDLFSGIGGFRYALESMGHKCVGFSEIDKYAVKTYKANFDTSGEKEFGDIREVDINDIPDFDLLVAGFPCQAFSINGKRLGFEDTRGTLFFEVVRILKGKQPSYFILENVKGLISHNKPKEGPYKRCGYPSLVNKEYDGKKKGIGETLKIIEEVLAECGYVFVWKVLDTKDYGLPQHRERIFFVGQRKDLGNFDYEFPPPEKLLLCVKDLLEKNVDKKYYISPIKQNRILEQLKRIHKEDIIDTRQSDIRIYKSVSPTVRAQRQGLYVQTAVNYAPYPCNARKDSLIFVGGLRPVKGNEGQQNVPSAYTQGDRVYDANGIVPTLCAEHGGRFNFLISFSEKEKNIVVDDQGRKDKKLKLQALCPTLKAESHGNEPKVIVFGQKNSEKHNLPASQKNDEIICIDDVAYKPLESVNDTAVAEDEMNKRFHKSDSIIQLRRLTPKECLRLQGFPDSFYENAKAVGISDTQLYRQAGNAVSTTVVRRIVEQLEKIIATKE